MEGDNSYTIIAQKLFDLSYEAAEALFSPSSEADSYFEAFSSEEKTPRMRAIEKWFIETASPVYYEAKASEVAGNIRSFVEHEPSFPK